MIDYIIYWGTNLAEAICDDNNGNHASFWGENSNQNFLPDYQNLRITHGETTESGGKFFDVEYRGELTESSIRKIIAFINGVQEDQISIK